MKRGQVNTQRSTLPATPDFGLLPGEWADEAACRGSKQPDDWHPGHDANAAAMATERAITICRTCPVRTACLQFALNAGARACQGVWGATTYEQRRQLLKRHKDAA